MSEFWHCCGAPQPKGFSYLTFVTVCDTCFTQFPYYDCYCELDHECTQERREANFAYWMANQ